MKDNLNLVAKLRFRGMREFNLTGEYNILNDEIINSHSQNRLGLFVKSFKDNYERFVLFSKEIDNNLNDDIHIIIFFSDNDRNSYYEECKAYNGYPLVVFNSSKKITPHHSLRKGCWGSNTLIIHPLSLKNHSSFLQILNKKIKFITIYDNNCRLHKYTGFTNPDNDFFINDNWAFHIQDLSIDEYTFFSIWSMINPDAAYPEQLRQAYGLDGIRYVSSLDMYNDGDICNFLYEN